jgi:hypothetical protein
VPDAWHTKAFEGDVVLDRERRCYAIEREAAYVETMRTRLARKGAALP